MNRLSEFIEMIFFVVVVGLNLLIGLLTRTIKLPVRLFVCSRKGHDWRWLGNGFFGMFAPKKPLKCNRCGKLSTWDDADD